MNDKLRLIADRYGEGCQLLKLAEECAEYSAAMLKWDGYRKLHSASSLDVFKDKRDQAAARCLDELADVLLLARQVEYLIEQNPAFEAEMKILMNRKCARQLERIKEEFSGDSTKRFDLRDTIDNMISDDYRERLIAEYQQLSIRKRKLGNYLWAIKEGKAASIGPELHKNLWQQFKAMARYKKLMEERARLMKLTLTEMRHDN